MFFSICQGSNTTYRVFTVRFIIWRRWSTACRWSSILELLRYGTNYGNLRIFWKFHIQDLKLCACSPRNAKIHNIELITRVRFWHIFFRMIRLREPTKPTRLFPCLSLRSNDSIPETAVTTWWQTVVTSVRLTGWFGAKIDNYVLNAGVCPR